MGNRATIIFADGLGHSPAIYLHWNGGPESVYRFLRELEERGAGSHDHSYAAARFVQVCGDFMDFDGPSGLSLGIESPPSDLSQESLAAIDPGDNGVYLVHTGTLTVRRFGSYGHAGFWDTMDEEREREEALDPSHNYEKITTEFRRRRGALAANLARDEA
jgi:hypothetical protein